MLSADRNGSADARVLANEHGKESKKTTSIMAAQQSTSSCSPSLSLSQNAPCLSRSSSAAGPPTTIAVQKERDPSPGGVIVGGEEENADEKRATRKRKREEELRGARGEKEK